MEIADEHALIPNAVKSKFFATKMKTELKKLTSEKSSLNTAADSYKLHNIPESHVYNTNKGTTGKVTYVNPDAPKVDHRNQFKFDKPEAPDVEQPFKFPLGSLLDTSSYQIPDSIHLFAPPPEQQNNQINQNKPNLPE